MKYIFIKYQIFNYTNKNFLSIFPTGGQVHFNSPPPPLFALSLGRETKTVEHSNRWRNLRH